MRQSDDLQGLSERSTEMTLRDLFAAEVVTEILKYEGTDPDGYDEIAKQAYQLADAMLRARGEE